MSDDIKKSELAPTMLRRLDRLVFMARLVLFWEDLWPRLWPVLIFGSLFLGAALFNLFSLLAPSLHMLVLGLCGFGLIVAIALIGRQTEWPSRQMALRKLEKDSQLENQPLLALQDRPAGDASNKFTQAIWIRHQDRMAHAMEKVRLNWPRSTLYKKDPYSLRAALILILVLGAIEARFDWRDRLKASLLPDQHFAGNQSWKVQGWVNAPPHTGLGPVFLKADAESAPVGEAVQIVQNSRLLLRLEGRPTRDKMVLSFGPFEEEMQNLGQGSFSLETELSQGKFLSIKRNKKLLYQWPIELIADEPPLIKLEGPARAGYRGHFTLDYKAADDFGLKEQILEIRKGNEDGAKPLIISQNHDQRELKSSFRGNFADHPWAGQEVVVTPRAIDNAGQSSYGQSLPLILPTRTFAHPLAKQLVEMRQSLFVSEPDNNLFMRYRLQRILEKPIDFDHQIPVYLGLKVASERLDAFMDDAELASVRSILWETAVHLDEGASGTERNQLDFMSRQMQDLLNNTQDRAAMEALFEQMQSSLDQYLRQMMQSQESLKGFEDALNGDQMEMVGRDELMELLERARELMRAGNMEAARAVMDQFQSILSRLAMQKAPDAKEVAKAKAIMEALRNLQKDQQNLLDRTFQRTRSQDRPSLSSTKKAIEEAEEQNRIREALFEQIEKLNEMKVKVSRELHRSGQAMKQASKALEKGLDEDAILSETQALERLQNGLKGAAQSLAQKMGMQPMPNRLPGFDPMGRGRAGRIDQENSDIVPSEVEMHQAREILQELYRRAGQKTRTDQELKYIERLLERF